MTVGEARRVIAAYNAWVELWNRHELDQALPLSPAPPDGSTSIYCQCPRSALCWRDSATGRTCLIRVDGWRPFVPNGLFAPFLRQPIDLDRVVWGGWGPWQDA